MSATTERTRRRHATHQRLVRAAYRKFARHGIAATRVADVAAAASVAHGTAFLHFPTRRRLIAAVIKRYAGDIALRLHLLVGDGAGVRAVLEAHLAGLREHEDFYRRLIIEGPQLDPAARATIIGINSAIALHLSTAAEREAADGRIRAVDPAFLFNLWIGLVHHHLLNRDLFAPRASVLEKLGPSLIKQFLDLLSVV